MDDEGLSAVAQLLSGSTGPKLRTTALTTLIACTVGDEDEKERTRQRIGTTSVGETIIRRLLTLTADKKSEQLALTALVNLSENEDVTKTIIRAKGVENCTSNMLDILKDSARENTFIHLYSGLLSTLTRIPDGVDTLVGKHQGTTAPNLSVRTLLQLVTYIDRIPQVLWMANACSSQEGRAALLLRQQKHDQPLSWLLKLIDSSHYANRLAVASAIRNCAMAEDCHDILVQSTNVIDLCLSRIIASNNKLAITLSQIQHGISDVIKQLIDNPTKANPEDMVEVRLIIVEALLLLCKTKVGRDALIKHFAYFILLEWSEHETYDKIIPAVTSITGRLVADAEEAENEDTGGNDDSLTTNDQVQVEEVV